LWLSMQTKYTRSIASAFSYALSRIFRLYPCVIVIAAFYGLASAAGFLPAYTPEQIINTMLIQSVDVMGMLWSLKVEVAWSGLLFLSWLVVRGPIGLTLCLICSVPAFMFWLGNDIGLFSTAF